MQEEIDKINNFLKNNQWCDFEIIELKGNLRIGGKTSFSDRHDIVITFMDVFFMQILYEWKTDTQTIVFEIPDIQEQRTINLNFDIEQGFQLFKIHAEDIKSPLYVSSKGLLVEFM
ncbi:hypothetical protein [Flavobacterium quisquiliarum]|uniref:Immunity protein 50 n=1 Tax=Flavobacterium quisquiliarum TaxID=1834436 RepID=A0ABV8WCG1_9FLAO|nr:hypothetical protein [Flavobacterium quisquiliarum]MBW1655360.1 hypothetical protein [Flavobacterium quisquiliarum]NWL00746.1 hypothetical protein [Flavobacterium collinsii]